MKEFERDPSMDPLLRDALASQLAKDSPGACFDAETLASFVDGHVSKPERIAIVAHASTCARCQAMLAAMARTTPDDEAAPRWRLPWRWLVPVTAAAAVLALWIAVPRPAPPTPSLADRAQNYGGPASRLEPDTARRDQPAIPAPPPQASAPANEQRRPTTAAPAADAIARSAQPTPQTLSSAQSKSDLKEEVKKDAAPKQAPVPESLDVFAAERQRAPAAAARPEAFGAGARAALPFLTVASPDASSRWRVAQGASTGIVERSIDGGATWQPQSTGSDAALAAGTSPSALVCWLVGARGTVLVTTDGASWRRVSFPDAVDLISISAVDDRNATVVTADNRRFSTRDGGTTWSQAPLQENPAAPF